MVVASGALHTIYFMVLLCGYCKADLTIVYPLARGSGPLLSSMVAILFSGEHISTLGFSGIVAVVVGVFLVAGGPGLFCNIHNAHHRIRLRKGMLYGILTGAFIASYTVVDGNAVKFIFMSPVLIDYFGNFVRLAFLLPALFLNLNEARTLWQTQRKYATVVGVISPISDVSVLCDLQVAALSHVAPAREISMVSAAPLGGQLLGEGDRIARFFGAVCVGVGVMALAMG